MITQNDLDIENLSYTKKDFGQIYPELLDLAKQLSSKWDPENTNESDPGIVLLKLAAFVADKNNYNIDKNILEQFLTSCTQETSMNRLCELIGYNRHYYRSATAQISFRYTGKLSEGSESTGSLSDASSFTVNPFDTTFKTQDGIVYTLLTSIGDITEDNRLSTGAIAIEGELNTLKVLDNEKIQLQNLDSNNRIYFPDVEVAENGIIINNEYYSATTNPDAWHRVDNLNDQPLHSKIFKFGYDSEKGFPYLEFPEDISNLIGDGLTIKYIISKGILGKVVKGDLSTFSKISITATINGTPGTISALPEESDYVIVNSSSVGAADPETLTESYNAAKKVVGTFETLVSAQDYSNYLNNYTNDSNNKIVSNVVATDIRTDPYYSTTVFTRNPDGGTQSYYKTELKDTANAASFYVTLHGFTPVNKNIDTKLTYETTYSNVTDTDIKNAETEIAEVKSIAQFLKKPNDLNVILGNYKLNVNITPTYKVDLNEEQSIINNIKTALYENFNSQKLDFGQEIPYDSLVDIIQNSDERIKTVSLMEPDVYYTYKDINSETPVALTIDVNNKLVDLVSANIVAGTMPLYTEDTSLNYDYNMDLSSASTAVLKGGIANLQLSANTPTILGTNETVQIVTDSFITKLTYPVGVYYSFKAGSSTTTPLQKDTPYTLQDGDTLYIAYTDSSDTPVFKKYTKDSKDYTTFIANFSVADCADSGTAGKGDSTTASKFLNKETGEVVDGATKDTPKGAVCMYYLGTTEQIEMVTRNSYTLPKRSKAFWLIQPRMSSSGALTNESGDLIFTKIGDKYTYILEENEYFIYPSDDLLSINLCGAGTKLYLTGDSLSGDSYTISRKNTNAITLSELMNATEDGDVGTFENAFAWEFLSANLQIEVVETVSATYTDTDTETVTSPIDLDRNWKSLGARTFTAPNNKQITFTAEQHALIRTIASFVSSAESPYQKPIHTNITLYNEKGAAIALKNIIQTSTSVDSYNDLIFVGAMKYKTKGATIVPETADGAYVYNYPCNVFCYDSNSYSSTTTETDTIHALISKELGEGATTNSRDEYVFTKAQIVAFGKEKLKTNINAGLGLYISVFDTASKTTQLFDCATTTEINISAFKSSTDDTASLYISKPKKLELQRYLSEAGNAFRDKIIGEVKETPAYDYLGEKNTYKYISSYTPLYSFFDENNIYNKFTIAKIDFDNSNFNVIGGNLKYVKN